MKTTKCLNRDTLAIKNLLKIFKYCPPFRYELSEGGSKIASSMITHTVLTVVVNTGSQSIAANTGYISIAINTGFKSVATNTGDNGASLCTCSDSTSVVVGKKSLACGWGINNQAKAGLGSWIALSEWKKDDKNEWHIHDFKTIMVDGVVIKADTFYILKDGEFVEV